MYSKMEISKKKDKCYNHNMRQGLKQLYIICKFEILRLIANWRRTLKLFLVPAIVMLVALYAFPMLVNYITTGSLGRTVVYVLNAPDEFADYADGLNMGTTYKFVTPDASEVPSNNELKKMISKGTIVVTFPENYKEKVENYYTNLGEFYDNYDPDRILTNDEYPGATARIKIMYNGDSTFETRAMQLQNDVISKFVDAYPDLADVDTSEVTEGYLDTNGFNPILKIIKNRAQANNGAARIVPQILILMLYYSIYSLSLDVFAGDRERGFLNKMLLAPISSKNIIWGKLISVLCVSVFSSFIMFFMIFLASWLNFSNDALSFLPFGFLLLPGQMIKILIIVISEAMLMTSLCAWIVFDLTKPEDTTINLQLPLVLILAELFIMMFTSGNPFFLEYIVPIHNSMAAIQAIIYSTDNLGLDIIAVLINILLTSLVLREILKKEEFL